ncbi:reverse transcriptase domain-containing protein [Tanacetum coccineum]
MTEPSDQDEREETPPPLTKEQIEGHISAMKSIIKDYNRQNKADPIRLDFETDNIPLKEGRVAKGKDVDEEDLSKPFKEKLKTPLTRRIIEFAGPEYVMPTNITLYDGSTDPADHLNRFSMAANSGEWPMPVWCRMFQQTLDGGARGWLESFPLNSINEWCQLTKAFTNIYSIRRACYKEPHEITKVMRRANETLPAFKERWTVETGLIMGVPEVMKISSFIDSIKSPELAKRFSSNISKTVDEMMRRVDEFVRAKEAYARTELLPGESRDIHRRLSFPAGPRDVHQRLTFSTSTRKQRQPKAPYPQRDQANKAVPVLSLDSLIKCPKEILATETQLQLPAPRPVANLLRTGDPDKYCDYHQDKGHHTNDCIQLRKQLEIALESGKLNHLMKDLRQKVGRGQDRNPLPPPKVINMVRILSSKEKKRKDREATKAWMNAPITIPGVISDDASDEPLIIKAEVEGYLGRTKRNKNNLWGYVRQGGKTKPLGKIDLEVCFGNEGLSRRMSIKFLVIRALSPYNIILVRPGLKALHAIPSTIHSMIRFPTPKGIATLVTRSTIIAECRLREEKQIPTEKQPEVHETGQPDEGADLTEQILVNPYFPDQIITIEGRLSPDCKNQLKTLLINNMEVFAWEPPDMTGVPRKIIEHSLNVNPSLEPFCQKRRTFSPEKSKAVTKEVKAVMGFKYKCFLDANKGYHQIQMVREDEEKTTFYTEQRTYCYMKMSFGLKNAGATYQRLVDSTFQSQIGKNLEAYVDDMVIKSKDEKDLLADIAKIFKNLKAINIKLNPKKCSFGVEEGKFLGYMVTSEGIRANPKKTKAISDLTSLKTLKEMQSLSGKQASLNRFLAKSAEKAFLFFNTLKNITKKNKHEYRWTPEAEEVFQQMKRLIISLPSLTPPFPKETLYAYLAVAKEAVSAVLLTDRNERQCPVQYMSRMLNDAEKNYSPLEKLALSLVNLKRRLRRYFEAHPVEVITDQPIKNILSRAEALGKLSKYAMEIGTYKISFIPMNAIKGQVLVDFLLDAPDGEAKEEFGLPRIIVTDNEAQLVNEPFKGWLERERAGWVDELPNVLWAHRTSIKQSNGETSFSLTYGSKAVIPAKIGIPSYRTLMIREEYNEEEQRLNLDLLQERREAAAIWEAKYKTKMEQYYNKRVRPAGFRPGEFVYRRNEARRIENEGNWDQIGKAHIESQKHSRMALKSCKQWRIRWCLKHGTQLTYANATCRIYCFMNSVFANAN